jgi:hypothetical protein
MEEVGGRSRREQGRDHLRWDEVDRGGGQARPTVGQTGWFNSKGATADTQTDMSIQEETSWG